MIAILCHEDEFHAPPSQPLLAVEVIGTSVFLTIGDWVEVPGVQLHAKDENVISVPIAELRRTLDYLEQTQIERAKASAVRPSEDEKGTT